MQSALLAALAVAACGQTMDTSQPDRATRVRSYLTATIARSQTPGLQYLVVDSTGPRFEFDGGWADIAHRVPMQANTTMMAYSMSKTVTAMAVLQLVSAGRIRLEDPVERYVPGIPYGGGITVRQLLSHTSGIPNPIPLRWVHPVAQHAAFDEGAALATAMAAHPKPAFAPGVKYAYSNIGYWLLGKIVERASGESFPNYVTSHVLGPLGISPRELGYAIPDTASHAHGYLEKYSFLNLFKGFLIDRALVGDYEGRWLRIEPHYLNGPAVGGLVGTARGFATFLRDQLRRHSVNLDDRARALLYEQQQTTAGTTIAMTLGWHIGQLGETRFYYKEGGGGGFHCEMRLYPAAGIATVVMTNATGFKVKGLLNTLDAEFLQ